jgi:signal transduction histidine kinase
MQLYVLAIALVAMIIAFLVSYSVSKKFSQPIKNISATADRMAKGDYSVTFTSTEYEEIANLSDSLNYLKDEVKKSDDFQKELLANVSHDFKTPLTMIKAYASMIKEISGNDPEKRDKHLQVIIDESDRLTGLVNDVLTSSKISSGLDQLNKKVFNLTEYLYGVINKFGYLQETQGYTFMLDIDPNLYTIADEEKIGQVIYNLLSNAVNYTGEDKTVYISLKYVCENNRIKFSVRDTGKGISDEELAHIWDRYYRSADAHSRPVKGTGLGLNIVKVILRSHAFDFGVTSKLGEGSTFYVDFPEVSPMPDDIQD